MAYQSNEAWNKLYRQQKGMAYPAEGVIRIFKGKFPSLKIPANHEGLSILDLGCGDGRHLPLFHDLRFKISAVEITDAICQILREQMTSFGIEADVRTGHAGSIPFPDAHFDRILTWNSCYYMSLSGQSFEAHVAEMARVIKPEGWIVASVPKETSFIFKDSVAADRPGYRVIKDDYFDGSRNGEIMRCFSDRNDVQTSFSNFFTDFCHADIDMDWFGLPYHWHVFCAKRSA